jgi:hypothetical protein
MTDCHILHKVRGCESEGDGSGVWMRRKGGFGRAWCTGLKAANSLAQATGAQASGTTE